MSKLKAEKDILFFSHYTVGTPYEQIAHEKIIPSFKKFNLNYKIVPCEHRGSWRENANIKSELFYSFIKDLDKDQGLVYIDCDATIEKYPDLFFHIDKSVAVHELDWDIHYNNGSGKKEILGGTVYMTREAEHIAKFWKDNAPKFPREPHALEHYIRENKVDFYKLPVQYCAIVDREYKMPDYIKDPVVKHWQASRKCRRSMG